MSRWRELLENHSIHETLKWLRNAVSKEFENIDENEISEKRRLLKIVSKFEEVLSQLDAEIIPFDQLDSLNNGIRQQNINAQINSYAQNGNVAHLVEANNLLSKQLTQLCLLSSLAKNSDAYKPIKELEELVDTATNTLARKKDKLLDDLAELDTKSKNQDERLTILETQIEKKKTEVDSHITNWQSQFSNAQESRSQDYNKWREFFSSEKDEEIKKLINEYKIQFENDSSTFNTEIDKLLKDGNEKHQSILDLYEITAGDSVGAGYIKNADDEKKQADKWRSISLGFIVSTVIWILIAYNSATENQYIESKPRVIVSTEVEPDNVTSDNKQIEPDMSVLSSPSNHPINWYKLFLTFSLSGVLLWGSAYAAQQSTKHRSNEKKNRWFALEVKAFDPFISTLETTQRNELKKQLTERLFGQYSERKDEDHKIIDEHALKSVTDTIVQILSKLPK